jgi:hypothetical protein
MTMEEIEKMVILFFLEQFDWCQEAVAVHLDLAPRTIRNKVRKWRGQGIIIPTYRNPGPSKESREKGLEVRRYRARYIR